MRVSQKRLATTILFLLLHSSTISAQQITVAVVDFRGRGISKIETETLADRLRDELFHQGTYIVLERGMMESILSEQDFQLSGCTSNECLVEVGELLGARQMIGGSISKIGAMYTVSARIVDVQSGKVLKVSNYDHRGDLEALLTEGMRNVALSLSGFSEKTVAIPVEIEVEKPDMKSVDQSIKRLAGAIGWNRHVNFWGNPGVGGFLSISLRSKRAFGSKVPIRPVLSFYYLGNDNRSMVLLDGAYAIEGSRLHYNLLFGAGLGDGIRSGPSFGIQINSRQGSPVMIEGRIVGGGIPTNSLSIGYRFW